MEPSSVAGAAFAAMIALAIGRGISAERSVDRMNRAAAGLLGPRYLPARPGALHPDQDGNGEMPPESPVMAAIKDAENRKYGGDQNLREAARWSAPRLVDPRPEPPKREWA
jgi:hypothetical protein